MRFFFSLSLLIIATIGTDPNCFKKDNINAGSDLPWQYITNPDGTTTFYKPVLETGKTISDINLLQSSRLYDSGMMKISRIEFCTEYTRNQGFIVSLQTFLKPLRNYTKGAELPLSLLGKKSSHCYNWTLSEKSNIEHIDVYYDLNSTQALTFETDDNRVQDMGQYYKGQCYSDHLKFSGLDDEPVGFYTKLTTNGKYIKTFGAFIDVCTTKDISEELNSDQFTSSSGNNVATLLQKVLAIPTQTNQTNSTQSSPQLTQNNNSQTPQSAQKPLESISQNTTQSPQQNQPSATSNTTQKPQQNKPIQTTNTSQTPNEKPTTNTNQTTQQNKPSIPMVNQVISQLNATLGTVQSIVNSSNSSQKLNVSAVQDVVSQIVLGQDVSQAILRQTIITTLPTQWDSINQNQVFWVVLAIIALIFLVIICFQTFYIIRLVQTRRKLVLQENQLTNIVQPDNELEFDDSKKQHQMHQHQPEYSQPFWQVRELNQAKSISPANDDMVRSVTGEVLLKGSDQKIEQAISQQRTLIVNGQPLHMNFVSSFNSSNNKSEKPWDGVPDLISDDEDEEKKEEPKNNNEVITLDPETFKRRERGDSSTPLKSVVSKNIKPDIDDLVQDIFH